MKTLFDSSAFAKRYINERGSQEVYDICQATTTLALSVICLPEILSALNRLMREKCLSDREYHIAKNRLAEDVEDAVIINLTPSVISTTTFLLENNALRAMDAIHLACALEWKAELFVSSDERQIKAAKKAGLHIQYIESGA
jgi:predicted nucleic acid-binding protein